MPKIHHVNFTFEITSQTGTNSEKKMIAPCEEMKVQEVDDFWAKSFYRNKDKTDRCIFIHDGVNERVSITVRVPYHHKEETRMFHEAVEIFDDCLHLAFHDSFILYTSGYCENTYRKIVRKMKEMKWIPQKEAGIFTVGSYSVYIVKEEVEGRWILEEKK